MAIILTEGSNGTSNYTPHPEGSFGAVCVDVYDEGLVEETWEGVTKMKHKLRVYFFCGEWTEENDEGKRFPMLVSKRFTATLHENGALRPWLEAWRGRKFTAQELKGFDIESLIGAPALIQVTQVTKGDRTYANIDFAGRLPKGMEPPTPPADFKRRHVREAEKAAENGGDPEAVRQMGRPPQHEEPWPDGDEGEPDLPF